MAKMLAIIGSTLALALIGVAVAYVAVENLPLRAGYSGTGKDPDLVMLLSVLPPLFGIVLGFAVGCVAAYVAKKTST
jgi:hypothetical protein